MARIDLDSIKRIEKERNMIHTKVATTYTVFEEGGEKFLQIDTYGRSGREVQGKISQSVQFDRKSAEYLLKLFAKEFNWNVSVD